MDAGTSLARQTRTKHRHELRTLTYVTLDQANGGIVRNLSRQGIGVQAVAAIRAEQEVRVRFELGRPKLRVEARGQVMWSTASGQCGIRFLDLPPTLSRQIQDWIFSNLLEGASVHAERSIFAAPPLLAATDSRLDVAEEDGLMVSASPLKTIQLPQPSEPELRPSDNDLETDEYSLPLEWLFHPFSGAGISWAINGLAVLAGLLLFAVVFLSITHETPTWPVAIAGVAVVPAMYWGFFRLFGGCSLGSRLARLALNSREEEEELAGARFR